MLALLETELPHRCHMPGTSIHENGIKVSIKRNPREIIRFFLTDDQSVRAHFAMSAKGIKCSDYLLIYAIEDSMHKKEILCFIELKGSDLKQSVDQICDAYKHIAQFSQQHINRSQRTNVTEVAAIFLHQRAPSSDSSRERKRLEKIFGDKNVYMKYSAGWKNPEFSQFVRKIYA
jgi:hypothetical protein